MKDEVDKCSDCGRAVASSAVLCPGCGSSEILRDLGDDLTDVLEALDVMEWAKIEHHHRPPYPPEDPDDVQPWSV